MGAGAVMLGAAFVGGTISGGLNASEQQKEINATVCNIYNQMQEYKQNMAATANILSNAAGQEQVAAQQLMENISDLQGDLQVQQERYKSTYNTWVVTGVIFLIILIFLFASKKVFLHATTEGGTK